MTAYRLTIRIESLEGPVPPLDELRRHLLDVVAEALPDATATGLSVQVAPDRMSAQVRLDVQTATVITADETDLIESGTLGLLPSPLSPLTLEFLGPDVTVTAEPLEAAWPRTSCWRCWIRSGRSTRRPCGTCGRSTRTSR